MKNNLRNTAGPVPWNGVAQDKEILLFMILSPQMDPLFFIDMVA